MSLNLVYFTAIIKMLLAVLLLFDKVGSGSPKLGNNHNSEITFVFLVKSKSQTCLVSMMLPAAKAPFLIASSSTES